MFWRGFEKRAAEKAVAKAAIFHKGQLLMGVRQDNGKWTEPGGHLEGKETPTQGVLREVKEETGISLKENDVKFLGSKEITKPGGEKIDVHAFRADLKEKPPLNENKDPDHEVFGWSWIHLKGGKIPQSILGNLHVPHKNNVLHKFLFKS